MPHYAKIIINFATASEIDRPFTYEVDSSLSEKIKIGSRVLVPFGKGNKPKVGYVIALTNQNLESGYRIKKVNKLVEEEPILDENQVELALFIQMYYGTSYAAAIDVVLPPGLKDEPINKSEKLEKYVSINKNKEYIDNYCNAKANYQSFINQKIILEYLGCNGTILYRDLLEYENINKSAIKTLEKNGLIDIYEAKPAYIRDNINYDKFKVLNEEQESAVEYLNLLHDNNIYRTVLLEGVTGSGKTEVFLHTIKTVLENEGTALVLVPEIALTSQTLNRFKERFGNRVELTHSRMSAKDRQRLYMKAKNNEVSVIIGPRSAVFMPLQNLKLIVIDEAHESTYKSEVSPKYHAIDIAKKRMELNSGQVLLATATPSVDIYNESRQGEYGLLRLKERAGGATLPEVNIVDMRLEMQKGNTNVISTKLHNEIESALESGGQVMLLLNRRGYSTFISCRSCGYVVKCEHCDVSMTYHAKENYVQCHYCGNKKDAPHTCPECGSHYIRFMGSGTQKAEEYLNKFFGQYGIARMDMDTTSGKEGHNKILDSFRNRDVNILVGTQMIAKGHDFPGVTLVGVLAADSMLFMEDFRSSERTYQLLTQAMGRAGRANLAGRVVIQTYNPEHMVMDMIKNNGQEEFYHQELVNRKMLGYPPYSHIFSLLVLGEDEKEVIQTVNILARYYKYYSDRGKNKFRVIGPSSAVITKIGDSYRWRILVMGDDRNSLLTYGKFCLEKFYDKEVLNKIKIQWDIDPISML